MNRIKQVTRFQTPDGSLYKTKQEAEKYLKRQEAIDELEDWLIETRHTLISDVAEPSTMLRNILVHNAPKLVSILKRID
jgi:dsDNA-binding SOS-regulon protein